MIQPISPYAVTRHNIPDLCPCAVLAVGWEIQESVRLGGCVVTFDVQVVEWLCRNFCKDTAGPAVVIFRYKETP